MAVNDLVVVNNYTTARKAVEEALTFTGASFTCKVAAPAQDLLITPALIEELQSAADAAYNKVREICETFNSSVGAGNSAVQSSKNSSKCSGYYTGD